MEDKGRRGVRALPDGAQRLVNGAPPDKRAPEKATRAGMERELVWGADQNSTVGPVRLRDVVGEVSPRPSPSPVYLGLSESQEGCWKE